MLNNITQPGKVYLVGAGPGDIQLLTVRAKQLIQRAETVVYDRLVGAPILALIPNNAKMIDVGKTAGNHKVHQKGINKILVDEAMTGAMVVRLKGGDPFVFGRGGEEIEELINHGISYEVIPGITSAIAASCYAGIPVTHRDLCSSLHIITAHKRSDYKNAIDYSSIAHAGGTMVFLMGVSELSTIVKGLMNGGMASQTPAAIVESGTLALQRSVTATLDTLEEVAKREQVKSPAIVIVGKVVEIAEKFDWRSSLPLFGARVVVTRTRKQASKLCDMLRELGAEVLEAPALEIEPIDNPEMKRALQTIDQYRYIVFTSSNGVETFMQFLRIKKLDVRVLSGVKIAAIGEGTANALNHYAIQTDLIPSVYDAKHLGEAIANVCQPGDKVLTLRAKEGSMDLNNALLNVGIELHDVAIYKANMGIAHADLIRSWIKEGKVYAALGSAKCAQIFAKAIEGLDQSGVYAVCIGKQTAEGAKAGGIEHIEVAQKATTEELVNTLIDVYNKSKKANRI